MSTEWKEWTEVMTFQDLMDLSCTGKTAKQSQAAGKTSVPARLLSSLKLLANVLDSNLPLTGSSRAAWKYVTVSGYWQASSQAIDVVVQVPCYLLTQETSGSGLRF